MCDSVRSSRRLAAVLLGAISLFTIQALAADQPQPTKPEVVPMSARVNEYATVQLRTDLASLTENERAMLPHLIAAAQIMDGLFWKQACGDKGNILGEISDPMTRRFAEINYGPWDRLKGNEPFVDGVGPKPAGAQFYPHNMAKEEFQQHLEAHPDQTDQFKSLYTVIQRDPARGLVAIPYSELYKAELINAAGRLQQAAQLAKDPGLKNYLNERATALTSNQYYDSDLAWMDMKDNRLDLVIGPIETYEDQLFGYKAAFEAYVLVKDRQWSQRLSRYAKLLPELQEGLPVADRYKQESPGTDSDLNAYDVVYYAGDCNAGAKTIAINLPNDEKVQQEKGSRRLQLKNAMRAKYSKILVPLADILIAEDQRKHITFDAFFGNTMFHEVAHGLGIKNTLTGKGTVRQALQDQASALEEGKADILGLYMVTKLFEQGELTTGSVMDNYVTFLAGIFRSVRFGAASAHGRANMVRFNFFKEYGAFSRDEQTGQYRVHFDKMKAAMEALSAKILTLQGDGDYAGVVTLMADKGNMGPQLEADLQRLNEADIPVDIVFEQGMDVLTAE